MKFYAIAHENCADCFWDFELNTFGDGICKNNLIPSEELTYWLRSYINIIDGKIIEVEMNCDNEGFIFEYENIWSN